MAIANLKVTVSLSLSIALLCVPLLRGQNHYSGCYDEVCDSFERCWSNAATRYYIAKIEHENIFDDDVEDCVEDNPIATHALVICVWGAQNQRDTNLEIARKTYCQDKKNCCSRLRPRNPHPGSLPCHYYNENCPAGCSG